MQLDLLLWRKLYLREGCVEDAPLQRDVEPACRRELFALERWQHIWGQLPGQRVGPQVIELVRIGADMLLRNQSDLEEALAVLVRFGPRVRPGVVTAGAVGHEKRLAGRRLLAIDLAEQLFRPF